MLTIGNFYLFFILGTMLRQFVVFFLDDTGYCTPAEELQADWPKQVENLRLDDDQEFPAVTRLYT